MTKKSKEVEAFDNATVLDVKKLTKDDIIEYYNLLRADYLELIKFSKRQTVLIRSFKNVFKALQESGFDEFIDIDDETEEAEEQSPPQDKQELMFC